MKHLQPHSQFLNEKKPAGAPDWHDSDAPDAEGRFKELSPKDLAAWLIKTRKKDLRKITGSLNQQIVFNRNEDPKYADKMEKTRKEVYKQLGREDLMDSKQIDDNMKYIKKLNESAPLGDHNKSTSDGMSYGQLERCMDYSKMIRERIEAGQSLDPWMHSQIAIAENELNSVFDALDADDGVVEANAKPGPDPYETGLDDEEVEDKNDQIKKQSKMDDDDPEAYKEMPGDVEAREKGKVKTSKHVKSYHELYGDDEETNEAKVEVERYVRSHGKKPKGWGRWLFSYNRDGSEMFDIPTAMNWSDAQKWAKNKAKEDGKDYVYVMESDEIIESTMSDIHQLAGEVKSEDEFVKKFFKEYGAKIKKTSDSIDWVKSLYKDTVNEAVDAYDIDKAKSRLENVYQHLGVEYGKTRRGDKYVQIHYIPVTRPQSQQPEWVKVFYDNDGDLKKISKELGMDLKESVVNEEKAKGDRGPIDDEKIETALKKKEEETGVPMEFLRIIMRRGMAAWKSGHRPGATQQQWGYGRIGSFLTKQPGTWGGADADVAKEVRDGGHDKKLKKG
jgi:hypothetical protein